MFRLPTSLFLLIFICQQGISQTYDYRHPWYAPFAQTSIWNTPIGANAVLVSAGLPPSYYLGTDDEWHIRVETATSTEQPVNIPSSWGTRWPGTSAWWQYTMRVPNNLIIPDANPPNTPNACAAFLMPDKTTLIQLEPACRVVANQPIVGYRFSTDYSLFSNGEGGTHYGSSLSAIGGSIRLGELTSSEPIRHALKINIWGNYLYYSASNPGFRYPATSADACKATCYTGTNPKMVMGTLLTIPQNVTAASLGITTSVGRKLLVALQQYGAYVVDNSAWDAYDWCVERGVVDEVQTQLGLSFSSSSGAYFNDMQKLITQFKIVDNNTASSIGGGGTPVTSLAVPFCTQATGITIVAENIASSTNKRYKIPNFQASTYNWVVSGGAIVGSTTGNSIVVNWGSNTSGSVSATVSNEYINFSNTYMYSVLPLTLLDFKGSVGQNMAQLSWSIADAKDVKSFDIQRDTEGGNFETIGTIAFDGKVKNYIFDDANFKKQTYYRLKINDFDGKISFSKTISLENGKILRGLKVYPNPATDVLTIENADGKMVEIVNVLGQVVLSNVSNMPQSSLIIQHLKSGIYFVRVGSEAVRFVKN